MVLSHCHVSTCCSTRGPNERWVAGFEAEDHFERVPYSPEVEHKNRRVYVLAIKPERRASLTIAAAADREGRIGPACILILNFASYTIGSPSLSSSRGRNKKGHWIWPCHIDLSHPRRKDRAVSPGVRESIRRRNFFIPIFRRQLPIPQYLFYPSIDPVSEKNRELETAVVDEGLHWLRRLLLGPGGHSGGCSEAA